MKQQSLHNKACPLTFCTGVSSGYLGPSNSESTNGAVFSNTIDVSSSWSLSLLLWWLLLFTNVVVVTTPTLLCVKVRDPCEEDVW